MPLTLTNASPPAAQGLYQATRLNDGFWTGFQDVQSKASWHEG
ncbi:hypothetical protein [Streptomyces sp. NPDC051577]